MITYYLIRLQIVSAFFIYDIIHYIKITSTCPPLRLICVNEKLKRLGETKPDINLKHTLN